jgi:hypothetical protein
MYWVDPFSNIAIEAPQWRYLILMFVDDFVELNFSDRNFLNLGPNPDTNLAFHRVCPEALTIPLKTAKNQFKKMEVGQYLSHPRRYAESQNMRFLLFFDSGPACAALRRGKLAGRETMKEEFGLGSPPSAERPVLRSSTAEGGRPRIRFSFPGEADVVPAS